MADQRRDSEQRPSPEALLEAARREESRIGKLQDLRRRRAGVGKTYEMLQQARARKKDGYDVVVGVVETHGRKETEALLEGLEVVPRRHVEYKGQWLEEMDLDAIIARRPQIVLVDELAHTNVEGSRHPKRYLDVEELLSHGIDVYTTVNIQHIESLNDVVAQITHVRVRETVPDAVFDRADAVELVDLTPDDLIQRLKEGKVYVPKQAERALEHFFSPANLTALRELALRRTAERVDEQLLTEMQARAIQGPWAAGERILVCISEDPRAPASCATPSASPTGCMDRGRRSMSRAGAACSFRRKSATALPTRCGSPRRSAARPITLPGRRPAHRRRRDRLRASQQRHADRHRQVGALALVRDPAWLGGARSRAPVRQHQRPRHRRRCDCRRADPEKDRSAPPSATTPFDPRPYVARAGRGRPWRSASAS